jgi:subtilisin family serine protease
LLTALAAASLLTTMGLTAGPAAAAPGSGGGGGATPAGAAGKAAPTARPGTLAKSLDLSKGAAGAPAAVKDAANKLKLNGKGTQPVFVQLADQSSATVSGKTLRSAKGTPAQKKAAAIKAVKAHREAIAQRANALTALALGNVNAAPMFTVSNALSGFALRATPAQLAKIAGQKDVVKISTIVPKHPDNAHTAQLTNVLESWNDYGKLGDGVTVGVIDTGIDYTHADFGGPGSPEAYDAASESAGSLLYNWRADLPELAQAKIAGGWDFVGDNYDADPTSDNYQPVPHPDPNPLDCNEHGTHVAGTVAGYGENADGDTFTGDYTTLSGDDLDGMRIGPGMAPLATLYSFKVFGCEGSTDVVIEALDTALDPNNDGDFSDALDIVNLSLGSDYGTPDDPENDVVDALAENGVLPVIAMGNGGDLTDIGGSPGNAVRALAVASSVDSFQLLSGIKVNAPESVDSPAVGQVSVAYPWTTAPDVTGQVVELSDPDNLDGCDELSAADAELVTGKVAWLTWDSDDSTRRCGSAARAGNVKDAGAIGAIFTGDVPVFTAGITGDEDIPVFQLTMTETQRLQDAADAGSLNVTFTKDLVNNQPSDDPSLNDLVSSFSSRGTHGSIGVVKPDVTAPGDTIASAGMGTGNEPLVISGTSMATPHTAGIAALVKEAHPAWSTEQLKAAIMNGADHDLYTEADQSGDIYGPARVGAGRIDAHNAINSTVLAYSSDVEGGVSASFGVVEAPAGQTVTVERHVRVQNTSNAAVDVNLGYSPAIEEPGVSYSLSADSLHLDAFGAQDVTITLTAVADDLRHTIDPTMQFIQSGVPRQFLSDASGWLMVAAPDHDLRVPVYGAVKPVSQVSGEPGAVEGGTGVVLTGSGFEQGDPTDPSSWVSLVSVMDFGAESPQLQACEDSSGVGCTINQTAAAGDIQYVGTGVSPDDSGSVDDGWLWFGISTYADWATIGNSTIPYVDFDTNGDGDADYEVYAQNVAGTDVLVAWLIDLSTGKSIDAEPVNMAFGDLDTNVFDSNVVLLPVWPKLIGLTDAASTFPITYTVGTFSYYTNNANGDIDDVGPVTFDAANPAVQVDGPLWQDGGDGFGVPVGVDEKFTKTLVFHLHNASGTRAQTLLLSPFDGFTDLSESSFFYDDIAWLVASGIANGKADGTYGVADPVSRGQMAAFLYRYLHPGQADAQCEGTDRTFADVPASSVFCGDIEWLADAGIANGTGGGKFSPAAKVTRQALAMFVYRTVTGLDDATCEGDVRTFSDVPATNIACGDIEWLADAEIVNGTGDGSTYSPAVNVTRGQMAAFLHRAWEYQQAV